MPGKKPRILCLDDQPENLQLRIAFLEQFGCEVTMVTDADACLQAATHESFDLALLDYHLGGGMTGGDVAHDLRSRAARMPLVIWTGDPEIPESAKRSVDKVLGKGDDSPTELLDVIQNLLPGFALMPPRKPIGREASLRTAGGKAGPGADAA
jgi:CheY-like chemotaxis protein